MEDPNSTHWLSYWVYGQSDFHNVSSLFSKEVEKVACKRNCWEKHRIGPGGINEKNNKEKGPEKKVKGEFMCA